jgi:hypothetical protein
MKKITMMLLSLLVVTLFACEKPETENSGEDNLYKNVPTSVVPQQLATGVWFTGTISPISYFDRNGHEVHKDYEAGREYQFFHENGKGRIKFWQYIGTRGFSSCNSSEYYTYKEGSVVFEGDKFTFYPVKGNFKTVKNSCSAPKTTVKRDATGEDLKPVVFLWEMRVVNGKPHMYTFLETDINHVDPVFVYSHSN